VRVGRLFQKAGREKTDLGKEVRKKKTFKGENSTSSGGTSTGGVEQKFGGKLKKSRTWDIATDPLEEGGKILQGEGPSQREINMKRKVFS